MGGGWMGDGGWRYGQGGGGRWRSVSGAVSADRPFPRVAAAAGRAPARLSRCDFTLSGLHRLPWISRCQWREGWQGKDGSAPARRVFSGSVVSGCLPQRVPAPSRPRGCPRCSPGWLTTSWRPSGEAAGVGRACGADGALQTRQARRPLAKPGPSSSSGGFSAGGVSSGGVSPRPVYREGEAVPCAAHRVHGAKVSTLPPCRS